MRPIKRPLIGSGRFSVSLVAATVLLAAGAVSPLAAQAKVVPSAKHKSMPGLKTAAVFMQGGTYDNGKPTTMEHDQFILKPHLPKGHPRGRFLKRPRTDAFRVAGLSTPGEIRRAASITVYQNKPNAANYGGNPIDTTEASAGNVVVYADNEYLSLSVDGGATFNSFYPGNMYPPPVPAGGVCCDQVLIYSPRVNLFIWLNQYWNGADGRNFDRLAVFPPSSVTPGGLTSWTYWDISAASFPGIPRPFLDFPRLALGNKYLYFVSNNGCRIAVPNLCQAGKVYTSVLARIGLDNLAHGLNLANNFYGEAWRYILGPRWNWGHDVSDNTGSRAFWGFNGTTSSIQVSYWDESSNSWNGPTGVSIFPWPNSDYTAKTPDNQQWVYTYGGDALVGTRTGPCDVWFGWTAAKGTGQLSWLSNVHIELVDINVCRMSLARQRAVWNPSYAFAYPDLTTSQQGHLGMSMGWGGGSFWANFAVGDLTLSPFLVWNMTSSNANCGCGRWGDYTAIRPSYGQSTAGSPSTFTAAGYGTNTNPTGGGGTVYDPHWVSFSVS